LRASQSDTLEKFGFPGTNALAYLFRVSVTNEKRFCNIDQTERQKDISGTDSIKLF
jgi:hypothetical protein